MNILLISDDPNRKSFSQIHALKQGLQETGGMVDLLVFSGENVLLNKDRIGERHTANRLFENILTEKNYAIIAISLRVDNLKALFQEDRNFLKLVAEFSPLSEIFIFGGSSLLKRIQSLDCGLNLVLFKRPGVAKLTLEFKNELIGRIKNKLVT